MSTILNLYVGPKRQVLIHGDPALKPNQETITYYHSLFDHYLKNHTGIISQGFDGTIYNETLVTAVPRTFKTLVQIACGKATTGESETSKIEFHYHSSKDACLDAIDVLNTSRSAQNQHPQALLQPLEPIHVSVWPAHPGTLSEFNVYAFKDEDLRRQLADTFLQSLTTECVVKKFDPRWMWNTAPQDQSYWKALYQTYIQNTCNKANTKSIGGYQPTFTYYKSASEMVNTLSLDASALSRMTGASFTVESPSLSFQ